MTAVLELDPDTLYGSTTPRLGPPRPLRSDIDGFRREADCLGISLFPWQDLVGWYLNAIGPAGSYLYAEVADVVSRRNGKTEVFVPHIVDRLLKGRRIMHTAQNRELPREVFGRVADHMYEKHWADMTRRPRFANGQEEIKLRSGGDYRIIAPTRSGPRGHTADDLIIDEVRELDTLDFIAAARPAVQASANPQVLYGSNAGDAESVVLNGLRKRRDEDPSLAYLEWSASPERAADDVAGWLEANPAAGHMPWLLGNLAQTHRANMLAGSLAIFETEHLCRWVISMAERLIDDYAWAVSEAQEPLRMQGGSFMGVGIDPKGKRASAAVAWKTVDGIAMRQVLEMTGDPIDVKLLDDELLAAAKANRVMTVGYDPLTDARIAKLFRKSEPIAGGKFANATSRFVNAIQSDALRWEDAAPVTDDLVWTTRKPHDESGSFQAVRADDHRPITAALASIRAVWLASLQPSGAPRVY